MQQATLSLSAAPAATAVQAESFYRSVLEILNQAGVPYLVGGGFSFSYYTGISRHTKDLDIFILREDYPALTGALHQAGFETELPYPHWLAKVRKDGELIDLIFGSGNGIAMVDADWFAHAVEAEVMQVPVKLCPPEESIWSKAFIMERERYDGADVAHLLRAQAERLDWQRLLRRFGPHWRVLLSHLTMFGFVYPCHRNLIPQAVMTDLLELMRQECLGEVPEHRVCFGPLLSREQYLVDIEQWDYRDARILPVGNMSASDTAIWTDAIPDTPATVTAIAKAKAG